LIALFHFFFSILSDLFQVNNEKVMTLSLIMDPSTSLASFLKVERESMLVIFSLEWLNEFLEILADNP